MKVYADKGVISKFGIPHKIMFVDQLPKTSVGKIDKKALRQKYDAAAEVGRSGDNHQKERARE